MNTLSPTGLRTHDYTDDLDWSVNENYNIQRLNNLLLPDKTLSQISDVEIVALQHDDGLEWDSISGKWINKNKEELGVILQATTTTVEELTTTTEPITTTTEPITTTTVEEITTTTVEEITTTTMDELTTTTMDELTTTTEELTTTTVEEEFTPEALFANGEQGAWYDFSDLDTLFQDSSRTTPVTATDQSVGGVLDKSGNDNHLGQSTSDRRPIFKIDGDKYWIETSSSGSGRFLTCGANDVGRNVEKGIFAIGLRNHTCKEENSFIATVATGSSTVRMYLRELSSNLDVGGRRLDGDSLDVMGKSFPDGEDRVVVGRFDWANTTLELRVNGQSELTDSSFQTSGSTQDTASDGIGIGANINNFNANDLKITEIIIVTGDVDFSLIPQIEEYLEKKTFNEITTTTV